MSDRQAEGTSNKDKSIGNTTFSYGNVFIVKMRQSAKLKGNIKQYTWMYCRMKTKHLLASAPNPTPQKQPVSSGPSV